MTAPNPAERIAAAHAGLAPSLAGGPAWSRRRARSLGAFVARGLPDRRDENWRYLDHARIAEYRLEDSPRASADAARLAGRQLSLAAARIVLVDGRFDARLSDDPPPGVRVSDVAELMTRDPEGSLAALRAPADDPDDRYALLADAFAGAGAVIRVEPGAAPDRPLYLVHVSTASVPATHHGRLAIEVGANARFTLVEHFIALGPEAALGNLAAELAIAAGAELTHVRLHDQGAAAAQVETWVAQLAGGSHYDQHLVAIGSRLLRSNLRVALDGPGAGCRLTGLFMVDGDRQVDIHTQVAHRGPATVTQQEYRGVAAGRGRGSFNGRIVVEPTAHGANAGQTSRNLLLSPLAEINARPQLEIHVDDVQCRHGATTGSHDESQVFYLRSRGLDEAAARAILTFAFCRDILARLPLAEVRSAAEARVIGALPDRDLVRGFA